MDDLISRKDAIDAIWDGTNYDIYTREVKEHLEQLPSADLPKEYAKSVWLWMLNYQIKTAELQGIYTPYEVLSWVANDWRKENGLDKQTTGY